jgi:hypothetical protein
MKYPKWMLFLFIALETGSPGVIANAAESPPPSPAGPQVAPGRPARQIEPYNLRKFGPEVEGARDKFFILKSRDDRAQGIVGKTAFEYRLWDRVAELWKKSEHAPEVRTKLKGHLEALGTKTKIHSEGKWFFFGTLPGLLLGASMGGAGLMGFTLGLVTGGLGFAAARLLNAPRLHSLSKAMKTFQEETLPELEAEVSRREPQRPVEWNAAASSNAPRGPRGDPDDDDLPRTDRR